jgi:hypothetical protein
MASIRDTPYTFSIELLVVAGILGAGTLVVAHRRARIAVKGATGPVSPRAASTS